MEVQVIPLKAGATVEVCLSDQTVPLVTFAGPISSRPLIKSFAADKDLPEGRDLYV